jgi:hypothetical protein
MQAILRGVSGDRYGVSTLNLTLKPAVITIAACEPPLRSNSSNARQSWRSFAPLPAMRRRAPGSAAAVALRPVEVPKEVPVSEVTADLLSLVKPL